MTRTTERPKTVRAADEPNATAANTRTERWDSVRNDGDTFVRISKQIARLDHLDPAALIGLLDLLSYGDTTGDNSAVNPLGHFIKNILIEVAVRGPQELNANRVEVQEQLEQSYEYLESDLDDARDLLARYPEYLAKHPIGERLEASYEE